MSRRLIQLLETVLASSLDLPYQNDSSEELRLPNKGGKMSKNRVRPTCWLLVVLLSLALPVAVAQALTPGTGWNERTVNGADLSQNAIAVVSGYDIDGDSRGEFIVLLGEDGVIGADDVVIFEWNGVSAYEKVWGVDLGADTGDNSNRNALFVGDSDGDNKVEIIVGQEDLDRIKVFEYSGSGQISDTDLGGATTNPSETPTATLVVATTIMGIIVTDLDQDNSNEIVVATVSASTGLYLFETNGDNSYASAVTLDVVAEEGTNDGTDGLAGVNVDLDGDGDREIAVVGEDDRLHIYEFDGSNFSSDEGPSDDLGGDGTPQATQNRVFVYDLDQDGNLEIIVTNQRDKEIYVYESTGTDAYAKDATDEAINNGTQNINAVLAGNLVGDSKGEIYYEDTTGAVRYREFIGSTGSFNSSDFGSETDLATGGTVNFNGIGYANGGLASMDGDNNRDIVLVRGLHATGNEIYVLESDTSKPTAIALTSFRATAHVQRLILPMTLFAVAAIGLGLLGVHRRRPL